MMDDFEELEVSGTPENLRLSFQSSLEDVLHCYDKHDMPYTKVSRTAACPALIAKLRCC